MASLDLFKITSEKGLVEFINCCNRDCTALMRPGGDLTFYASIDAAADHYFYTRFWKPSRQLGLSLTNGASENPTGRKHALDYPLDFVDEAVAREDSDDWLQKVHLLCLSIADSHKVPSKRLKCALAHQIQAGIKWDTAVAFEVDFRVKVCQRHKLVDCAPPPQQSVAPDNSDLQEEPPAQRRRLEPGLVGLPVIDCSQDNGDFEQTLYVPLAEGALLAHVISKASASGIVFEPSFFASMASYPGDLRSGAIPLFEDPRAALVQLKFQMLAAHASGQVHDPVQWNTCVPGFDPFNFEGCALAELTFKQPLWQKLHTMPILGKSRGCPIFHYKLAVPLPREHPGYSCETFGAVLIPKLGQHYCIQVSSTVAYMPKHARCNNCCLLCSSNTCFEYFASVPAPIHMYVEHDKNLSK